MVRVIVAMISVIFTLGFLHNSYAQNAQPSKQLIDQFIDLYNLEEYLYSSVQYKSFISPEIQNLKRNKKMEKAIIIKSRKVAARYKPAWKKNVAKLAKKSFSTQDLQKAVNIAQREKVTKNNINLSPEESKKSEKFFKYLRKISNIVSDKASKEVVIQILAKYSTVN